MILFPLPLTPADWIGFVWPNRRGAANNLVLLVLRQYIGAANLLAPIYWRCKHLKNPRNFLSCKMSVCLRLLVPIYWCYLCWQHQYQPIQLCLPRGKVYSFWWIFSPYFLHGDWYGSTPTPSPVSKGRDQWELRGGTIYTYIGCYWAPLPPPPPSVIFKKEKCRKSLQHHAYSVKRCLFNLLE